MINGNRRFQVRAHGRERSRFCAAVAQIAVIAAVAAAATPAVAHEGGELTDATAWSAWNLTPDIVLPTVLVAWVYLRGMIRRREAAVPTAWWRHVLFFTGLGSVFLALQSPIDPVAERLFFVHQIQHFLLRMMGPMLLALSWPAGLMTAGLPAVLRRRLLAPVISNGVVRVIFAGLLQPVVVTVLFIAALYVWEYPPYHDYALLNEPVHYLMHVTMLLAGILFWYRIFDRRPPRSGAEIDDMPARGLRTSDFFATGGLRYGIRLMMLWFVILSGIVLGAYTTVKTTILYPAYDVAGRLFGMSARNDEAIGGIIIWIPSSMMCLAAVLIIIHLLGLYEAALYRRYRARPVSNSAALLFPTTGAELIARARPKNRLMAFGFTAFVITVFGATLLIGSFRNISAHIADGSQVSKPPIQQAGDLAPGPALR
jgi:putative membrane protein